MFASVVIDGVLWVTISVAFLTVFLFPCSSGSNTQGKLRALEDYVFSAQKALQGSETETRELLGGRKEKSFSPVRGH